MLTAARESRNSNDFALVTMLGLLGLRIFETCGANIGDLGEEHGHRVLRVTGKGGTVVLTPCHLRSAEPSTEPSPAARAGRSCAPDEAPGWTDTPPPGGSIAWPTSPECGYLGCTQVQ